MHRNHDTSIDDEAPSASTLTLTDHILARCGCGCGAFGTAYAIGAADWRSAAVFAIAALGFGLYSIERPAKAREQRS